jgi:G2/mitotic-specific cyclin 1/2
VYKKYSNKKFLRASQFAREWAQNNLSTAFNE